MLQKTILIVDDEETNVENLMMLLEDTYDILAATDGESTLDLVKEEKIDLILLDIMMPGMDGFEVCKILKENPKTQHIPIIFITAKTDVDSLEKAYNVGGVDYITKPFRSKEVLSRVSNHLKLSEQQKYLEYMVNLKTKELQDLNQALIRTQKDIIFTMGVVGEYRSKETGNHVKRVAEYSKILALGYGLSEEEANLLKDISPMHDIGKVAIPDEILNKPGRLTPAEFEIMKDHSTFGHEILSASSQELLQKAAIVAFEHHEKWNGNGYPRGLKGENIHIYGRITAVADVFDALGSKRVYKEAWDDERIFQLFRDERGEHFEPKLVDIFFENIDAILAVRHKFKDSFEDIEGVGNV